MIVGIDVSKDKLDIYLSSSHQHFLVKNTQRAITDFIKNKLPLYGIPDLVVFEATGGYEKSLQACLLRLKTPYHKAHPNRVKNFGRAKGYFAKTDKIDARLLACYGKQEEVVADEMQCEEQIKIHEISARKDQVKDAIRKEKNKLSQPYLDKFIARSIKRIIKLLERELALIEAELEQRVDEDQALREKRHLLQTVSGIGKEISMLLVTQLPELGQVSREAISSLVGLAPQTNDSGKKKGYRSIRYGRSQVRQGLYMGALVAMRFNPKMKAIYTKLIAKGKKKKVALVAVMRKMLIMMNAMLRDKTAWHAKQI